MNRHNSGLVGWNRMSIIIVFMCLIEMNRYVIEKKIQMMNMPFNILMHFPRQFNIKE